MITKYEIHVSTKKTVGEILEHFKAKGMIVDYKMCKKSNHGIIMLKHTNNTIYHFEIKLYEEEDGDYIYEFATAKESEYSLMRDMVKEL